MKDIQNLTDSRNINIKKVGIKSLSYPVALRDRSQRQQHTVATINMYVNLPHQFKGTHMSRFLEVLNGFHDDFYLSDFPDVLRKIKERLNAEESHIELSFPYFFQDQENKPPRRYHCSLHGTFTDTTDFLLTVHIPLCPHSQYLQKTGAMRAEIAVRFLRFCWLEDIIEQAEEAIAQSSAVTSSSHTDSKKSEKEVAAAIAVRLERIKELRWFSVTVYNDNDIYSTFSRIESGELPAAEKSSLVTMRNSAKL